MTEHIMIDLETLDTATTAAVLSVGACVFDLAREDDFETLLGSSWEWIVDRKLSPEGSVSDDTARWWASQPEQERLRFHAAPNAESMPSILQRLSGVFQQFRPACVWANSPSFDCAILRTWYTRVGDAVPWKFWEERDVRTALALASIDKRLHQPAAFVAHRADHDAAFQALLVQRVYRKLVG